jgi:hypothetical protein
MKGIPRMPCQKSTALFFVEPTIVLWCMPWIWIFFTVASFERRFKVRMSPPHREKTGKLAPDSASLQNDHSCPVLLAGECMKISLAAIVVLAFPVAEVAAQQTPAAPPANPITAAFRTRTMTLQRNLAQAFDSIPASKFGYRPTPAQLTIGYIAQHLARDNYFYCDKFGSMKPTLAAADTATADSVKATWPRETLITKLKASFTFCENAFAQLDDARLADQVSMTFNGNTRNVARASMVLGHALDMADHYSQIANYMRLNNMIPPTALPRPRPAGQ